MHENEPLDYFPTPGQPKKKPLNLLHLIFMRILPILGGLLLSLLSLLLPPVFLAVICLLIGQISFHRSYRLEKPVPDNRLVPLTLGIFLGIIFYIGLCCFLLYFIFEPARSSNVRDLKVAAVACLIPAILPIILFGRELHQLHQK